VAMPVPSMKDHTTDEGWQLMLALRSAGYTLTAHTDVPALLHDCTPRTLVVQDKREWDGQTGGPGFDPRERFTGVGVLRDRPDVFKLTVLKDAHQRPAYHREAAEEMAAHGWVTYYDPDRVAEQAPFVRRHHLVRTYHTVDAAAVPAYEARGRKGCLLSGAVSGAYPLRSRLVQDRHRLYDVTYLPHPGYGRRYCHTPQFLKTLSRYKAAICTASRFQYATRKIVEATAAGCVVITNLKETLPVIDGNLVRIADDVPLDVVSRVVAEQTAGYDPDRQEHYARLCKSHYDYRAEGDRLASAIETLRSTYAP